MLFFSAPIGLALLLNNIVSPKIKRFVQSVVYLPHFIGWVILISISQQLIGGTGLLPQLLGELGLPRVDLMTSSGFFPWLADLRGGDTLAAHALFGVVAALLYWRLKRTIATEP